MEGMKYPTGLNNIPDICFSDKSTSCYKFDTTSVMLVSGNQMEVFSDDTISIGRSDDYIGIRTPLTQINGTNIEMYDSINTKVGVTSNGSFIGMIVDSSIPDRVTFNQPVYYNNERVGMDQNVIDAINQRLDVLDQHVINIITLLNAHLSPPPA